jgi:hypothetical protein
MGDLSAEYPSGVRHELPAILTLAKKLLQFYKKHMTTVKEIEEAVEHLPPKDLDQFRNWFEAFEAAIWDRQLENDVASGRLDLLAKEAQAEYKTGKTSLL